MSKCKQANGKVGPMKVSMVIREAAKSLATMALVIAPVVAVVVHACGEHADHKRKARMNVVTVVTRDCGDTDLTPCYTADEGRKWLVIDFDAPLVRVEVAKCNSHRTNVTPRRGCYTMRQTARGPIYRVTYDERANHVAHNPR